MNPATATATTNAPPATTPAPAPFVAPGPPCEAVGATVTPTPEGDAHPLLPFGPAVPTYQQED